MASTIPADRLVLELWLDLLEREGASVLIGELQDLYFYGRGQGLFPSVKDAFSTTEWGVFGEHLLQLFTADCSVDLLRLLIAWKRSEVVLCSLQPPILEVSEDSSSFVISPELDARGDGGAFSPARTPWRWHWSWGESDPSLCSHAVGGIASSHTMQVPK